LSIVAIINPISGAGADPAAAAKRAALVEAEAHRRGLKAQVHFTERAGHARELAQASAQAGVGLVIVWGGDGTLNEVGAGLIGSTTSLGLVPAGSGNGLANALGTPHEPVAALAIAFDGGTRTIDAGTIAGRAFFNVAGIGFDARVARLFNERGAGRRGAWPYVVIGVREGCTYGGAEYMVDLDGDRRTVRALLIAFANGREFGNGIRIAPQAQLDDGVLDVAIVEQRPLLTRFWHARHAAFGTVHLAPNVSVRQIRRAIVTSPEPMEYHVDGEPGIIEGPVEVGIIPGALRVKTAREGQDRPIRSA
jgi:YegS/Rv2252/BmrU family lipid kinase